MSKRVNENIDASLTTWVCARCGKCTRETSRVVDLMCWCSDDGELPMVQVWPAPHVGYHDVDEFYREEPSEGESDD